MLYFIEQITKYDDIIVLGKKTYYYIVERGNQSFKFLDGSIFSKDELDIIRSKCYPTANTHPSNLLQRFILLE
jgi:hypothetical protein